MHSPWWWTVPSSHPAVSTWSGRRTSRCATSAHKAADLAHHIAGLRAAVSYAETDQAVQLSDTQFHGWPWGAPTQVSTGSGRRTTASRWSPRSVSRAAHNSTTGAGVTVAVLDTGADPSQPALAGRLGTGWDYVVGRRRTPTTSPPASTTTTTASSTPPSGTVRSSAVLSRWSPRRHDPARTGFSTATVTGASTRSRRRSWTRSRRARPSSTSASAPPRTITSHVLTDAITQAQHAGVLVVGAAGNDGTNQPHFPAAQPGVLSTSALSSSGTSLAAFSDWGPWAQVAAPGQDVVGPLPDGTVRALGGDVDGRPDSQRAGGTRRGPRIRRSTWTSSRRR